jgi:hypothetical protein
VINSDEDLRQASEHLARLQTALAALTRDLSASSPQAFALLSEGPLYEIDKVQREIDVYIGMDDAVEQSAELWMTLRGQTMRWRESPSSVLTAYLDSLRKGVQSIAESTRSGRYGVRPTEELKAACDPLLVGLRAGSLRVGLRFRTGGVDEAQLFTLPEEELAKSALQEFLTAAAWVASGTPPAVLATSLMQPKHRRHILRALKGFVPRPRGAVEEVELSGRLTREAGAIVLTRGAQARIDAAFERAIEAREERYVGEVREIDLDKNTFELRNIEGIGTLVCSYAEDQRAEARGTLDKRVLVVGVRQQDKYGESKQRLTVVELGLPEELGGE